MVKLSLAAIMMVSFIAFKFFPEYSLSSLCSLFISIVSFLWILSLSILKYVDEEDRITH